MAGWKRMSSIEARAFLAEKGTKKTRDHAFTGRLLHWPYCKYCRLVALKNEPTRRAMRARCVTYE